METRDLEHPYVWQQDMGATAMALSAKVQVFLLTHNRPNYVGDAVASILNQRYGPFDLIVSDNSTNDETQTVLDAIRHPRFSYIRRKPSNTFDHLNLILQEVTAEYFVIFHDDDMMSPEYLEETVGLLTADPMLAGVGTACYFLDAAAKKEAVPMRLADSAQALIRFAELESFACLYLSAKMTSPFPSYMYRSSKMKHIRFDGAKGGSHSDVSFLLDVLAQGAIAWINKPLMYYRLNSGAKDMLSLPLHDKLKLLRYVYRRTSIGRHSPEAMNYRRIAWCDWLKYHWPVALRRHPRRYFRIFRIMLPYLVGNKVRQIRKLLLKFVSRTGKLEKTG